MATIAGSQFTATAANPPYTAGVNVVETTTGSGLPSTVAGAFNLEVFVGSTGSAPAIDPTYQGLAVLSPDGHTIDLVSGAFAMTDGGTGDTLNADGTNETVIGGASFVNLTLNGNNDVAQGGGTAGDLIQVNGTGTTNDTVNGGAGPETITVNSNGNTINAGSGADVVNLFGNNNTVAGGSGSDTINSYGTGETVNGGSGPDVINLYGAGSAATGGGGNDTIGLFHDGLTATGGSGVTTFNVFTNNDSVTGGSGPGTVVATGTGDTVTAGSGNMDISAFGGNFRFNDAAHVYADTITGFSQAAGDRIHLTTDTVADATANSTQVNGGQDTLITLSDNSTILLKGVTSINGSFFS